MTSRFALTAVLWLTIGGTVAATAWQGPPNRIPIEPTPDDTETRLQNLEWLVSQQQAQIQSLQNQNFALRSDLANMVEINNYVHLAWVHGQPTVRFEAVNLQVVNGAGTEAINGLGNIVIGYDAPRTESPNYEHECSQGTGVGNAFQDLIDTEAQCLAAGGTWQLNHKSGSHYLVIGDYHNYSGRWGIVTGMANTSNSPGASVTGGFYNVANGWGTSVSGGGRNRAAGYLASVSGGSANVASGQLSSVSGGNNNHAAGTRSSVTGGSWNDANGVTSAVTGGTLNSADNQHSAVSGGYDNIASGNASSISGGRHHRVPETFGWAAGRN